MTTVGGTLASSTALLSQDGAHLFVGSGCTVRVYSTTTGDRLLVLSGHAADVTAICRHPKSESQLYTASLDGTIKLWDYAEAQVQQTWTVGHPIESMVLPNKQTAVLSTQWRGGAAGRVQIYSFVQKKLLEVSVKLSAPGALVASPNGAFVATVDRNTLILLCLQHATPTPLHLHHTRPLTCVAFDSTNTHIAAGDSTGRIIIWSGLSAAADAAAAQRAGSLAPDSRTGGMSLTTIHWHAHAVGALCFSHDGAYLLSGGREAVLVIWQLETLKKTFLPRLGGPLTHFASCPHDAARYAVCQENNAVRIVTLSTMQVECSICSVRPGPQGASAASANAGAMLQPGSGYLVLPCIGSQLQFYDVAKDRHVARLPVVLRNYVSATDTSGTGGAEAAREPCVVHAAFSHDSTVMVTSELHPHAGTGAAAGPGPGADSGAAPTAAAAGVGEYSHSVKFWDAAAARSSAAAYTVNSTVHDPHLGAVTAVACHPQRPGEAVTVGVRRAGGAGEFRVWTQRRHRRAPGAAADAPTWHWVCRSVGSYKDLPMNAAAYSPDGSVLAVGAHSAVTLWLPETNALMGTLTPTAAAADSPVTHVAFVHASPFLVTAHGGAAPCLCVWNLLTLSLWWSTTGLVRDVASHPKLPQFTAVFERGGGKAGEGSVIAVLEAKSPTAVSTWVSHGTCISRVLYAPAGTALYSRATVLARGGLQGGLVPILVISDDRRMMLLPDGQGNDASLAALDDNSTLQQSRQAAAATASAGGGGYAAMYGRLKKPRAAKGPAKAAGGAGGGSAQPAGMAQVAALFDAPSHMLPSTTALCAQMLHMLLGGGPQRAE